jgi:hypothetical protein
MKMANDQPTNLRMGFGFQQARAAGAPYQAPHTAAQMDFHLKERAAQRELRALVESEPSNGALVRKIIDRHGANLTSQDILYLVRCCLAAQSETGFVVTGADGKIYNSDKVEEILLDVLIIIHEGRRFHLQRGYIKSIAVNPGA